MREVKQCPKCNGEMVEAQLWSYGGIRIGKKKGTIGIMGDELLTWCCRNCGYLEFYKKR